MAEWSKVTSNLGAVSHRLTPERIAGLVEGAASVAGQVELSALLRSTVEIAIELTGARYGALGVVGEHGGVIDFVHGGMPDDEAAAIGHPPKGGGLLGTITRAGRTIRVEDIAGHPDSVGFPANHPPMKSFLGVPVKVGERVFGNLYLTEKAGGFSEEDEILVEFLAVTAGSAISTLRLQDRLRRAALLEDRERIARDLHDSIIQDLFAVGLAIQSSIAQVERDPETVRRSLDHAVEQLDGTIGSLRRYIFDLRPPVWARPSLSQRLAEMVGSLTGPYEVRVDLDVACPPNLVPDDVAEELLATVKEALSNALRHAAARSIEIRVGCGQSQAVVSVSDDGTGFEPANSGDGGMGLTNMAGRVAAIGGSFRIESSPGNGTVVRATFPLT
jgi:signal transduction histidine kinase